MVYGSVLGMTNGTRWTMSLGESPMSRAWAAIMNNTKIAVIVKSASEKARVTSPST